MRRGRLSLRARWRSFARDRAGNIAQMFAFALVPLLATTGIVVDYSRVSAIRSKLDSAADSAVLAAVSLNAKPFVAASMPTEASVRQLFDAFSSSIQGVTITDFHASIVSGVATMTVTASYAATVRTAVAGMIGVTSVAIAGTATSKAKTPYVDFYLLLDNSPSMGLAATPADISALQAKTPDNCAFACHQHTYDKKNKITGDDTSDYYHVARNNNVTLRIDVLRTATQALTQTATNAAIIASQFRMGVYEFSDTLATIAAPNADLAAVGTAANAIDLAYSYQDQRDSQTSYDVALPGINAIMTDPGDGTSAATAAKFLFVVTDGVQDEPVSNLPSPKPSGNVNSNRLINTLNPALCQTIKSRGITIAVLNTPYYPVTNNAFYNQWVAPLSSSIPTKLQSCASQGFYFEITPTKGISEAMQAMFQAAVNSVLLTN